MWTMETFSRVELHPLVSPNSQNKQGGKSGREQPIHVPPTMTLWKFCTFLGRVGGVSIKRQSRRSHLVVGWDQNVWNLANQNKTNTRGGMTTDRCFFSSALLLSLLITSLNAFPSEDRWPINCQFRFDCFGNMVFARRGDSKSLHHNM